MQFHVVRPNDLRELFDTTPDIAGADLDISRFIREGEDSDCLVFWRTEAPQPDANGPRAAAMSVHVVRAFVKLREELLGRANLERRLAEIEPGFGTGFKSENQPGPAAFSIACPSGGGRGKIELPETAPQGHFLNHPS